MKKWMSSFEKCDLCGKPLKDHVPYFVDGNTAYGCWALMCPTCFQKVGRGLGTGKGQKYDGKTGEKLEG